MAMFSKDDLLDLLRPSPLDDGHFIHGRKYTSVAIRPKDNGGKWGYKVARVLRGGLLELMTATHAHSTEAWEEFIRRDHPRLMKRWETNQAKRDAKEKEAQHGR